MRNTHLCYTLLLAALGAVGWYRNQQQTLVEQEAYQPEVGIRVMEADIRSLLGQIEEYVADYPSPQCFQYGTRAFRADSLVRSNFVQISSVSPAEYGWLMDTLKTRLCQLADNDPSVKKDLQRLLPSHPDDALFPVGLLHRQTETEKTRNLQLLRTQYLIALKMVLQFHVTKILGTGFYFETGPIEPVLICDRLFPTVGDTLQHTVVHAGNCHVEVPRVACILVNGDTLSHLRGQAGHLERVYSAPGVYPLSVTMVYCERPFIDTFKTVTKDFWVRVR